MAAAWSFRPGATAVRVSGRSRPGARHDARLAFAQSTTDTNIWRFDLSRRGQQKKPEDAVRLIASTFFDQSPQYSPDGRRIAFVSNRSGSNEIWVLGIGDDPELLNVFGRGLERWSAPDVYGSRRYTR